MRASRPFVFAISLVALAACGERPSVWKAGAPMQLEAHGLTGAVAVIDDAAHRVMLLYAHGDQELDRVSLPVGHNVAHVEASPDGSRLFVLSTGDTPRRRPDDQPAALTVIDGGTGGPRARVYPLSTPLSGLAVDPLGKWAVVYAEDARRAFVQNPNQLVVIDLEREAGPSNPVPRTLRSYGSAPQRLTFSKPLGLEGGARRLLIVESQQDIALLDLDHVADTPPRPEITVPLTSGGGARVLRPAGVVVDDGDPARSDDARIGVRVANEQNVFTIQLAAATASADAPNDFVPKINLTDVGGVPSDIAFVRTDGGLRLAALVPSASRAVLVEPDTSITTDVKLPHPYARLSLVTDVVGAGSAADDVALLWSGSSSGVALWALGKTAGRPYRSVEVLGVEGTISGVTDVPRGNPELKILSSTTQNAFYVLNLRNRTVAPLMTQSSVELSLSPTGDRVWAYQDGSANAAEVDLRTLNPIPVVADLPIRRAFEIEKVDGGHALVALHARGAVGASVFDALAPNAATARAHAGLLLEGL